jgi:N-acetylglucosaminyldiphosphoundecaprenol N-acetyl-beta-D-mannosaminyltransferase
MNKIKILNINVDLISIEESIKKIINWAKQNKSSYICLLNVHMFMEAYDNQNFTDLINNANLVLPDGKPIQIAQKILGENTSHHIRGYDLTLAVCDAASKKNLNIGFYGSSNKVLRNLKKNLYEKYPNIKINFLFSPPYRPLTIKEDNEIIKKINSSNISILFIGLGCPKQEKWMFTHINKINAVMFGVGAAFDFIGGNKKLAPKWAQKFALEWIFRLIEEPKRLYKRYLYNNPRFILLILVQILKKILRL